jgi:carboxymethylenebutenolidase
MCLGGHLAFRAALLPQIRAAACLYPTDIHKCSLGFGQSDNSLARCAEINGELLMIFGRQDPHIPQAGRALIYERLTATERSFEWHEFNAAHAFMRDEGHRYNPQLAAQCYGLMVSLFQRTLTASP